MATADPASHTAPATRPLTIGPESGPTPPFPLRLGGTVVSGFGRGSKELGIPTANIPVPSQEAKHWINDIESGVYFGWAGICLPREHADYNLSTEGNPARISSKILDPDFSPPVCGVLISEEKRKEGWGIYPMVMSIGFNPFYKNSVRSAEVHVLRGFRRDFYGAEMRLAILGFIRKELDYVSLEALVQDIKTDCEVAGRSLGREYWGPGSESVWLLGEGDVEG